MASYCPWPQGKSPICLLLVRLLITDGLLITSGIAANALHVHAQQHLEVESFNPHFTGEGAEGVGESGWTAVRLSPMTHLGFLSILNEQAESPGPNTALARKLVDDLGLG